MAHAQSLEQSLRDCVALLTERVESVRPLPSAPDHAVVSGLELVGEARRMLDALGAELAGQMSRRSDGSADNPLARRLGEKSASIAVAHLAELEPAEARDWCIAGDATVPCSSLYGEGLPDRYPVVAAQLRDGALSPAKARLVIAAIDEVCHRATFDQLRELEALLVEHSHHLGRRDFERVCRQVIDHFDPDGAEPREDALRAQSGIQIIRGRDGFVTWIVKMHPEAAGFLSTAIDARTAPRRQPRFEPSPGPERDPFEDTRTLAQRRLDALVSIARQSLAHDHGRLGGTSVTMNVTVALEALITGLGVAQIDGIDEPISAATARRLACDARIIPIVLGGPSEPLDLGHSERLFSESQRRALALRDGGCVFDCGAPPGWCEVAHLTAWMIGGRTDLKNGALMCSFHHRRFDRDGWGFEWRDNELYLLPPASVDPKRVPRRAGHRSEVMHGVG